MYSTTWCVIPTKLMSHQGDPWGWDSTRLKCNAVAGECDFKPVAEKYNSEHERDADGSPRNDGAINVGHQGPKTINTSHFTLM